MIAVSAVRLIGTLVGGEAGELAQAVVEGVEGHVFGEPAARAVELLSIRAQLTLHSRRRS
jgi:hypothetical protein